MEYSYKYYFAILLIRQTVYCNYIKKYKVKIEATITYEDRAALYIFNYFYLPRSRSLMFTYRFSIPICISCILIILSIIIIQYISIANTNVAIGLTVSIITLFSIIYVLLQPRILIARIRKYARKEAMINTSYRAYSITYELSDEGLQIQTPYWKGVLYWNVIRHLGETSQHIFLHHSELQGYIIPRSSFRNSEEFVKFVSTLQQQYYKSTGESLVYTKIY